jgi:hypothetical protein
MIWVLAERRILPIYGSLRGTIILESIESGRFQGWEAQD